MLPIINHNQPLLHKIMILFNRRSSLLITISSNHLFCNAFTGSSRQQPSSGCFRRGQQTHHSSLHHDASNNGYAPVPSRFDAPTHLDGVEDAVDVIFSHYQSQIPNKSSFYDTITTFPPKDREAIGVASKLRKRLDSFARNGDCRRCWLQKRHCICSSCRSLGGIEKVNRLFLLTHHKEICMVVDTAKIILSSFPNTTRLVVNGMERTFQPSMGEMLDSYNDALAGRSKCLILFPTDDAKTFDVIEKEPIGQDVNTVNSDYRWDLIVIDGTWSQARKMYAKYFPEESKEGLYRVQLSIDAVQRLDGDDKDAKGHQLRRHPTKWREISTMEATRLLLKDIHTDGEFDESSEAMSEFQDILNAAARKQLGPPREKEVK